MRQLMVWVPEGRGGEVRSRAGDAGTTHTLAFPAEDQDGRVEVLLLHMPNDRFSPVLEALEDVDGVRVAFDRDSVILLDHPGATLPDQVSDVSSRGSLEVFIEGIQSLGGWPPFLANAAIAGAIAWAGLVTNTVFLLTAAMLIAPYAAPAMTAALATTRGDTHLLRRSVGRYLASVGVSAAVAAVLSLVAGVIDPSELMVAVASVPALSILLPVAAGAAGAINLGRADRTGITSGAGIGMLIALALAPQAALIGIGVVIGDLRILASALFVAALQLLGINLAAVAVLEILGLRRGVPWTPDGSKAAVGAALGVTVLLTVGLVVLQGATEPVLSREAVRTRAEAAVTTLLDEEPGVLPVEATARFPHASGLAEDRLVVEARVVPEDAGTPVDEASLAELVRAHLAERFPDVEPRVAVTVVGH